MTKKWLNICSIWRIDVLMIDGKSNAIHRITAYMVATIIMVTGLIGIDRIRILEGSTTV